MWPVTAQYSGEPGEALAVCCSVIWMLCPATSVVLARSAHDILAGTAGRFARPASLSWPLSVGTLLTSELPVAALLIAGAAQQNARTARTTVSACTRLTDRARDLGKPITSSPLRLTWTNDRSSGLGSSLNGS